MERTVRSYKEWHKSYELFVAYKKEFPDTPMPYNAEYHGYKLGHWVDTERRKYKKGKLMLLLEEEAHRKKNDDK